MRGSLRLRRLALAWFTLAAVVSTMGAGCGGTGQEASSEPDCGAVCGRAEQVCPSNTDPVWASEGYACSHSCGRWSPTVRTCAVAASSCESFRACASR